MSDASGTAADSPKPLLAFWWEWGTGSPFWASNDAAFAQFDVGPIEPATLGLPDGVVAELERVSVWHDSALNWKEPNCPGPWRQDECDRFNADSRAIFERCAALLEGRIDLKYVQDDEREDPDLDTYLEDPVGFRPRP
jgi:hypothetical protein